MSSPSVERARDNGRIAEGRRIAELSDLAETQSRIQSRVVGRERQLRLILAAVAAGRDMLLEGAPGTSKSTLLRAITAGWGIPLVFLEGNADLTPARLVGHHNPARVLRENYSADNFVDGPLLEAMRRGGFLYIEEFNRAPEDTLNTQLTAMAEREIAVPRVGTVTAEATFRVIASMNPYDNVGTTRLSTSVHDRLCRLAVTYQDEQAEGGIVTLRAPLPPDKVPTELAQTLARDAVALTRATHSHADVRQGSSVRGAIDLTLVAGELLALDGVHDAGGTDRVRDEDTARQRYAEIVYEAMVVALSGRIHLDETADATPEAVLRQIWEDHFLLAPATAPRVEEPSVPTLPSSDPTVASVAAACGRCDDDPSNSSRNRPCSSPAATPRAGSSSAGAVDVALIPRPTARAAAPPRRPMNRRSCSTRRPPRPTPMSSRCVGPARPRRAPGHLRRARRRPGPRPGTPRARQAGLRARLPRRHPRAHRRVLRLITVAR